MAGDVSKDGIFSSSSREVEYITSFTRVETGNESDEERPEQGKPVKKKKDDKKSRRKERKEKRKEEKEKAAATGEQDKDKPQEQEQVPRIPASKSTFAQISKELKARKLAAVQAALKARKNKKNKVRREQECYTDKDRAAAVNLGSKDIKQSLKLKKRQDRSHALQIPEEAEPSTLLALGNNELRSGDVKIALNFFNKAMELSPGDKNALVARSKCYLLLGEPQLALKDAEMALQSDKSFIRAIYQKAEALYHLGDFEHSLMYYHRGHRLRPELEIFRLGVQKAQEAIENTIGIAAEMKKPAKKSEEGKENLKERRRSKSAAPAVRRNSRHLLGELSADRVYLENLLQHPDIMCSNQEASNVIITQAEEGIAFLKSRQEFWRQQKPTVSSSNKKSN